MGTMRGLYKTQPTRRALNIALEMIPLSACHAILLLNSMSAFTQIKRLNPQLLPGISPTGRTILPRDSYSLPSSSCCLS
jgi:hypothetical protein